MTQFLVADVVPASCVDGPGNRYVVFLQGCTFNCLTCHNPQTISRQPTCESRWLDLDELVGDIAAKAPFLSGVTVSGGEATLQWRAVHELFRRLACDRATAHLTRLVDSNGDADAEVWRTLATTMHGAMVDLKAFDPDVHLALTGRDNTRVLDSIVLLHELERLVEVRLLIVPGANDEPEQLAATARWLASLRPTPSVVVQGFRAEGTRPVARGFDEATADDLSTVTRSLIAHGLPAASVSVRGAAAVALANASRRPPAH